MFNYLTLKKMFFSKGDIEVLDNRKNKYLFKRLDFDVSDENAWNYGLACGGSLSVYIEQIN